MTRSFRKIIISPSAAATEVAKNSCQLRNSAARPASHPWMVSNTIAAVSPTLAAARAEAPGYPRHHQRQ